jgi:pimeloyl-ACP methyl ester carboxylesterase
MRSFADINLRKEKDLPLMADVFLPEGAGPFPVVVCCHGFKGFKNWGFFPLLPATFAEEKLAVITFDFSCNGTRPGSGEIVDTEAFSRNSIAQELSDLHTVIEWVKQGGMHSHFMPDQVYLLGHSMGGGIALLQAARDRSVARLALWNSVSDWDIFMQQWNADEWRDKGFVEVTNSRTGAVYPLRYACYEDYLANRSAYHLGNAAEKLEIPLLLVHGTEDKVVTPEASEYFFRRVFHAVYIPVEDGDHTFGVKHPADAAASYPAFMEAVENTVAFFTD